MKPNARVSSKAILSAVQQLQRRGATPLLERLEVSEPDLAEYLMEGLSLIHMNLLKLGAPARETREAYRQVETLGIVCCLAARRLKDKTDRG